MFKKEKRKQEEGGEENSRNDKIKEMVLVKEKKENRNELKLKRDEVKSEGKNVVKWFRKWKKDETCGEEMKTSGERRRWWKQRW